MIDLLPSRISSWAAAQSIYGSTVVMERVFSGPRPLKPKLLNGNQIAIGNEGLVFKDNSLLQAIEKGFAMPELLPLLRNPFSAYRTITTLKRVSRFYEKSQLSPESLLILMRAGLESVAVYLNYHPDLKNLSFENPGSKISFNLAGYGLLGWLKQSSNGFSAGTEPNNEKSAVALTFASKEIAFEGLLRGVDQLSATATGEVMIRGNIPLMDKIGYASRMALREVPMPGL